MKTLMHKMLIWYWKRKARHALAAYESRGVLDCGVSLTRYIRPDVEMNYRKFQHAVNRLSELDSAFPGASKVREEIGS
mgnify:CR=1 FL=1